MREPRMMTFTGRHLNPFDIKPEDIDERDIAHALALINRFNGTTRRPISVAQHVVYVSRLLLGTGLEWQGLHHDDAEAIIGDLTKWFKEDPAMVIFRKAEEKAQRACYTAFGVPGWQYDGYPDLMHPFVKKADQLMVRFEGEMGFGKRLWTEWLDRNDLRENYPLISEVERTAIGAWRPWTWHEAEEGFLTALRCLRVEKADQPSPLPKTLNLSWLGTVQLYSGDAAR